VLRRRVLWGWVGETDSERADILKGWSSVQVRSFVPFEAGLATFGFDIRIINDQII